MDRDALLDRRRRTQNCEPRALDRIWKFWGRSWAAPGIPPPYMYMYMYM